MLKTAQILEGITKGVIEANNRYIEISGGWCIHDSGIESLASSRIAEKMFSIGKQKDGACFVTLETPYRTIIGSSELTRVGRIPKLLAAGQRADVVYWHKSDRPIGVIEVKRNFTFSALRDDITRTAKLIEKYGTKEGGTLRWGAVAALRLAWKSGKKNAEGILEAFEKKCKREFPRLRISTQILFEGADGRTESLSGFWAFAVVIRLKP